MTLTEKAAVRHQKSGSSFLDHSCTPQCCKFFGGRWQCWVETIMVRALSVKSPSSASANVCCAVRCMRPHGPARSVLGCRPALQVVTRAASVTVRRKFRAGPTAPCIGVPGPFRYEQDRSKFPRDGQLQGDLMHDARDLRVSFSEWARNFETQIEVLSTRSSGHSGTGSLRDGTLTGCIPSGVSA